ncbi:MAG: phenylalanine--tRNA ligase subunit beta [Acidobacteriota bacterium]
MKISYNWLKEYVDLIYSPTELAERLTMVGLAVENVQAIDGDHILEFDLTSNRPDALSHYGIAREAAAICGMRARLPESKLVEGKERAANITSVQILNPELCPRYVARVILGVKVGPSPDWLVRRLESVGQRSINNVADITNFVLWEQGHPLHAFDLNRLGGRRIVVRTARSGETLRTLDGIDRKLREDMLVIADAENPVAMAGIMGGEYSEISSGTEDVLLEAAYFDPASVRRTARALDMATDASHRFERGTDPEACLRAINRCSELICEIAGGQLLAGAIDVYPKPLVRPAIELRHSRIGMLTGLTVDPNRVEPILNSLGCKVETLFRGERWQVIAPTYRVDINIEEDLVEEIARQVGYDQIPFNLPAAVGAGSYLSGENLRRQLRNTLIEVGYTETLSLSWVRPEYDQLFHTNTRAILTLRNPIDEERPQMRSSLLPGLLDSVARNFSFGIRNVRFFEIGKCFQASTDKGAERPQEYEQLAIVATGQRNELDWQHQQEIIDFFDLKGIIECLLERAGFKDYRFERITVPYLHAGQSAEIIINGKPIGVLGQLAPAVRDEYKFKQPIFVVELSLDTLLGLTVVPISCKPLPKLQAVSRDISILVSQAISYAEITEAIRALDIKDLVAVRLFDVYTGKNLPEGRRSLSLNLRYQPTNESMTDEQLNALDEQIVNMLAARFEAQLRR